MGKELFTQSNCPVELTEHWLIKEVATYYHIQNSIINRAVCVGLVTHLKFDMSNVPYVCQSLKE